MKLAMLDHIVCPECLSSFIYEKTEWAPEAEHGDFEDIMGGNLRCSSGHVFNVLNGVPRLLVPSGDEERDRDQARTAQSFDAKWKSVPHYGYTSGTVGYLHDWYFQRYGWDSEDDLRNYLVRCQRIFDGGIGAGRDVAWYGELTMSPVFGVEVGNSVEIARKNIGKALNVHVAQADVMRLPFPENYFDFAISDFVLHHTPDTRKALESLVSRVSPGGMVSFYVYKKKGDAREYSDDRIREYTTEMSVEECCRFSEAATMFGRAVSEISLDLQRAIYWDIFKCFWNPDLTLDENISVNFDWYHPVYAWRHTPEEVRQWCRDLGLKVIHEDVGDSGISVRATKR